MVRSVGGGGLALACMLSACGGASEKASPQANEQGPSPLASIPYESCALAVTGEASARVVASIAPQGIEWAGVRPDALWSPTSITAVLPIGDTLVVLDGAQSQVSILNGRLERVATFGAPGEGPGEFRRASALTALSGNRLAVADPGTRRLTILTPQFRLAEVTKFPSGQLVEALAYSGDDIYFSQQVMPEMVSRSPKLGEALSVVRAGVDSSSAVVRLVPGTPAADSLLRLPGPNAFRVVAYQRSVLLIAPAAGIVDLFHDRVRTARLRTCMPPALDKALQQQLSEYHAGKGFGSQQSIPLVSDAIVVSDTVFLVGPVGDSESRLHIDAYRLDGSPIGSILVNTKNLRLPGEIKFWGAPDQLVAFGVDGVVMKIRLTRRQ
jgi:hypothetical protein